MNVREGLCGVVFEESGQWIGCSIRRYLKCNHVHKILPRMLWCFIVGGSRVHISVSTLQI